MNCLETKQERDAWFVQAVRTHRAAMYRVALSMLRERADAEDAVSEATMQAYAHIGSLRARENARAWLMRITVNACHAALRRRKREAVREIGEAELIAEQPQDSLPLWALVAQLPPKYGCVLQMFYGEDMRVEEIARALRLPKGTVSSRISRGRKLLRALIEKEERQ